MTACIQAQTSGLTETDRGQADKSAHIMKSYVLIAVIAMSVLASAISCTHRAGNCTSARNGTSARNDSRENPLGPEIVRTYRTPGQGGDRQDATTLAVRHRLHSGDGTFSLTISGKGGNEKKKYSGRRLTLRGTPEDNDATVWQCINDASGEIFDFLVISDTTLVLLGMDGSAENDTLVLVK